MSKRGYSVDVTQEEINTAVKNSSSHCMVADAIKNCYPDLRHVSVDIANIRITDPETKRRLVYLTPVAAQHAIVLFDSGKKPKPFKLVLGRRQLAQIQEVDTRKNRKKYLEKKKKSGTLDTAGAKELAQMPSPRRTKRVVQKVRAGNSKRVHVPPSRRIPRIAGRRVFGLKSLAKMFE